MTPNQHQSETKVCPFWLSPSQFFFLFCSVAVRIFAVAANILLIVSCQILELGEPSGNLTGSLGLFHYDDPVNATGCIRTADFLDEELDDKALKCAQVCAIAALGAGGIFFLFVFFKQCLCKLCCTQPILDMCALFTQLCLGLVYVLWLTDSCELYKCTYGEGADWLWLSQICWLVAGVLARCMRDGKSERKKKELEEEEF